ncbi:MAG: hypothetical protein Q8O67_30220 [Deltaproteobacteria bacterium]|nr:hypothetical protein [Deltaproteobacteria bacterium]
MTRIVAKLRSAPRAFVILVVMLMLAVATAIAVSQFTIVASQAVASVRIDEEIQARATAEGCLELLQSYADGYIGTNPPGFLRTDFDGLLDRVPLVGIPSDPNQLDDFLPSFGTRVLVPRSLTPTTGPMAAAHQWAFIARGTAPNQGGCLLRIEDNSDDAFLGSSVPVGTTQTPEEVASLGRDVPNRDRDRAIFMTAIGLFPVLPDVAASCTSTTDPTLCLAYERAHARVTIRRLFATTNPPQTPPAVQACDDVTIAGTADICGLGGVQGDAVSDALTTCGCGVYTGNSVTPATPPAPCLTCPDGCSAPSVSVAAPPPCTPPVIPNNTYYMDNRGFGNPGSNFNNIGGTIRSVPGGIKSCKFYIDRDGRSFVWDVTDTYANEPADENGDLNFGPLTAFVVPTSGTPTADQVIPNTPVHNCANYTGIDDGTGTGNRFVELPCKWDTTSSATPTAAELADGDLPGEHVTCDFTNTNLKLRQTPCWKPIADLGNGAKGGSGSGAFGNGDITIGGIGATLSTIPAALSKTGPHTEMSSNENSKDLLFVRGQPIPNIRDQTQMFATGLLSTTMCGDPNGCFECTGNLAGDNNDWWTECEGANSAFQRPCNDFHSHAHQNNDHIPWPAVFAWDVAPGKQIDFEFAGGPRPLNVTILSSGKIAFVGNIPFCCAECGEGDSCTAPTTSPGIVDKFIAAADCVVGGSQIPDPSFAVPPIVPGPVQFIPSGYGYAFKTDGDCFISGNSTVIGDIECNAIAVPNSPCLVGNLLVTGSSLSVGCTGGGCSPSLAGTGIPLKPGSPNVGVCLSGVARVLGDIYSQGSVCATSNSNYTGDIFTLGNASFASNFVLNGQVFANQDVNISSNATINFTGGSQVISAGSQGVTTFMETSW